MYESRIQFALDEFIKQGYFEPQSASYILKEIVPSGKADLRINVTGNNLVRQSFDKEDQIGILSWDRHSIRAGIYYIRKTDIETYANPNEALR